MHGLIELDICDENLCEVLFKNLISAPFDSVAIIDFLFGVICLQQSDTLSQYYQPLLEKV